MSFPGPTERLRFRLWTESDEALARELWGDPRVTALIHARGRLGEDEIRERLALEIATAKEHGAQYWPCLLRETGVFVGCAGLRPRDVPRRVYELGFHLKSEHWGKGLAREAASGVIAWAFGAFGAAELFAGHHPENAASAALLVKLGFRRTHEELYALTGLLHPSYVLGRAPRSA